MFDRRDVLERVNCKDCPFFEYYAADRDNPSESVCTHICDFGHADICENIAVALEELIDQGYLDTKRGYLAPSLVCEEAEKDIAFNVLWNDHRWWFVPYDASEPRAYDSLEDIWEDLFL